MTRTDTHDHQRLEAVRQACLKAAMAAYEDAGIRGLCVEGRWECALDAIRSVDLASVVTELPLAMNDGPGLA